MKKDALLAMGLTEELAEKAAAAFGEELKGFVPKSRFDEVLEERNSLRAAGLETAERMAALETAAGERDELAHRLEALEAEARQRDEEHAAGLRSLALENAIRLALTDAQDAALAAGLIDRGQLELDGDGNVSGLDEQVRALREAKPFLFRAPAGAGFTLGAAPAPGGEYLAGGPSMRDAIERHFRMQKA